MSLGLERDGQLVILAPAGTTALQLERLVRDRQDWLYGKLSEKQRWHRPARSREFVTGEGFWYAGRSYRLQVLRVADEGSPLSLSGGRFRLAADQVGQGRRLFVSWYAAHLQGWADEQVHRVSPRLRVQPRSLRVADLGHRWGACGAGLDVTLHWRVALLPRRMAEYVLMHELVHLEHHHHRAAFWERLKTLLPDYAARKAWLAQHGAEYDL